MFKAVRQWFGGANPRGGDAHRLYGTVVAAARQGRLYGEIGVPDTLDGRFEMLVLHAQALMAPLLRDGEESRAVAQALFDAMLDDLDAGMREEGVGDQVVPKRLKKMTRAFYGQAERIDRWWDEGGGADDLVPVLMGNITGLDDESARRLAHYLADHHRRLRAMTGTQLMRDPAPFRPMTPVGEEPS